MLQSQILLDPKYFYAVGILVHAEPKPQNPQPLP